jgi:hypothetical protein
MFINYFKSGFFSQYFSVFIIGLVLWSGTMVMPIPMPAPEGPAPFYQILYDLLHLYPRISSIIAFILLLFETYFFAGICNKHELVLKNSSLTAVSFIVLMSFYPELLTITPASIALFFNLIILYHLLIYYNKPEHLDRVYVSGFFTGISGLFYIPMNAWFLFILVALIVSRVSNWRAWFAALTGFVTPLIYLAVFAFWNDQFRNTIDSYTLYFSNISLHSYYIPVDFRIIGGLTLLLALWAMVMPLSSIDKAVETRAKLNVVFWTIFFCIATVVYAGQQMLVHVVLAMPVISLLITRTLLGLKKTRVAEIFLLVYFLVILANNYRGLLF